MDELFLFNNSTSGLETSVNTFLQYYIPVLTGLTIPLSLLNILIFLNTGILNSPSNLIYFNLVIMDLLNSIIGIGVSIDMWRDPEHKSSGHWGDGSLHQLIDGYLYIFLLNANIYLVFGLVIIRLLWINMSALTVIRKLKLISWISVGMAYLLALQSCVYHLMRFSKDKEQLYPDTYIEISDLSKCVMILATISLSVFTQIRIRYHKSKINTSTYNSASRTSFVITLNLAVSYSYYLVLNGARIYYKSKWNNESQCKKGTRWTWVDMFICDFLYLGVAFMCINSVVNNLILLCQVFL